MMTRAAFLLALLLAPVAAGAPVGGSLESRGAFEVDGAVVGRATGTGALLDFAGTLDGTLDDATVTIVNLPLLVVVVDSVAGPRYSYTNAALPQERMAVLEGVRALSATPHGDGGHARVLPGDGGLRIAVEGPDLVMQTPQRAFDERTTDPLRYASTVDGVDPRPRGPFAWLTGTGLSRLAVDGPSHALLTSADVTVGDRTFWTGQRLNESRSNYDPLVGSGEYVYDRVVALVTGRDGVWEGAEPWRVATTRVHAVAQGEVLWRGVQGDIRLNGTPLPDEQALLTVQGRLEVDGAVEGPTAVWRFEGDASRVYVDGTPLLSAAAPIAIASLAVLVVLWLTLVESGRNVLVLLAGRTGAQLVKARPLGNETRRQILRVIHEMQPVRMTEIQQRLGISANNVLYHVRVLHACDIVQQWSSSGTRNRAYMLNSGSLMFRTSGAAGLLGTDAPADVQVGKALTAANSHPVRRAVYRFLLENGPADYAAIRDHVVGTGVVDSFPQSTASHHLRLMEQEQVLRSHRQGRSKVYRATVDPDAARVQQYKNYLDHHADGDLVRTVAALGTADLRGVHENAPAGWRDRGPRHVRSRLQELTDLGLLAYDHDRRTYALAPHLEGMRDDLRTRGTAS